MIKPPLVQLWGSVLCNREWVDVYRAISKLYNAIEIASQPSTPTKTNIANRPGDQSLTAEALLRHWTGKYVGPSLGILRARIRQYEQEGLDEFYSRFLLFVQSSGTGKSRLADAFGEICPMVNYVIRLDSYGFPPRDTKMAEIN